MSDVGRGRSDSYIHDIHIPELHTPSTIYVFHVVRSPPQMTVQYSQLYSEPTQQPP